MNHPGVVATAAMVGTAIEWYDFFIYGTSAVLVLGHLFFPTHSQLASSLLAFSTFGVGFLLRPVGAVVFAHFGDRYGRKHTLVAALLLMGGATFAVGLLPAYDEVGLLAPLVLVLLRCVQGFAVGGEWGGAVLLAIEHAPADSRARYGSFPQFGLPLGLAASSLAILGASALSGDDFETWGWRLPFLMSGLLVFVGLWIRLRISETDDFRDARQTGSTVRYPISELLRHHRQAFVVGVALTFVGHASYIVTAFLPAYATAALSLSPDLSLAGLILAAVAAVAVLFLVGGRADRLSRSPFAAVVALCAGLWGFPGFALSVAWGGPGVVLAMVVGFAVVAALSAVLPVMLADQFPVQVRYTGVAVCHDISAVLAGALLPILVSWLVDRSGGAYWPAAAAMAVAGVVSVLGALCYRSVAVPST